MTSQLDQPTADQHMATNCLYGIIILHKVQTDAYDANTVNVCNICNATDANLSMLHLLPCFIACVKLMRKLMK